MSEKVSRNMAMKYVPIEIVYLDKQPNNFIVLFSVIKSTAAPGVRVVVKYQKAGTFGCITATVSARCPDAEITDEAGSIFKTTAVEVVQVLCKYDFEKVIGAGERDGNSKTAHI